MIQGWLMISSLIYLLDLIAILKKIKVSKSSKNSSDDEENKRGLYLFSATASGFGNSSEISMGISQYNDYLMDGCKVSPVNYNLSFCDAVNHKCYSDINNAADNERSEDIKNLKFKNRSFNQIKVLNLFNKNSFNS